MVGKGMEEANRSMAETSRRLTGCGNPGTGDHPTVGRALCQAEVPLRAEEEERIKGRRGGEAIRGSVRGEEVQGSQGSWRGYPVECQGGRSRSRVLRWQEGEPAHETFCAGSLSCLWRCGL